MAINESLPIGYEEYIRLTEIAHWIYRIWTIGFILFGIVGNLLALIIFRRWINRLSVYTYLMLFCLVNIFILMIDVNYHYLLPFILDQEQMIIVVLPIACKFIFFLTYFFRYLFIGMIVMINIDRCVYLTSQSLKVYLCQPRSARIICIVCILLSSLVNCHFLLYFNEPIISTIPAGNTCFSDGILCHCKTSNTTYRYFWKMIWPICHLIIFAIIPLLIIIISSVLIIRKIRRTRRDMQSNGTYTTMSIIRTILVLDLLFPLTIFPTLFYQIYVNYSPPRTCLSMGRMNLLFSIGFSMTFIKNAFAFVIFYSTGRKFRRQFSTMISQSMKSSFLK